MVNELLGIIKGSNRLVVGGMFFFDSPGHMLIESDYLIRLTMQYPVIRERGPIVFFPPTPLSLVMAELLRANNITVIVDSKAMRILRDMQIFYPDLILEAGLAYQKLVVPDRNRACVYLKPQGLMWSLRRDEYFFQYIRMHELWNATRGYLPLLDGLVRLPVDSDFSDWLDAANKYAVIQIKAKTGNSTAKLFSGDAYIPALEMLKNNGYSLVLAGREPMPEEFKKLGVIDYPRSPYACPKNDFILFSRAALGLVSPSGAGLFCDMLGIKCCEIGCWTFNPHPSEKTLVVPSRLRELSSSRILSFAEQVVRTWLMYDEVGGPTVFDYGLYENILPSADDICSAVYELINDESPNAEALAGFFANKIRSLDSVGVWKVAGSRIASSFLLKHPEYIT